jgi:glutamate-5-semialdehyde dehydrogenase
MRADMVAGLRGWASWDARPRRGRAAVDHGGWAVEARRAPLGVVGFVFEGRPNVFADAAGVVRTGNTVVFRIGSDALGTASAIVDHALEPALAAGLPEGTVGLVASAAHAAGWALFSDRGSRWRSPVVRARRSPSSARSRVRPASPSASTAPGAWLVAASDADTDRFALTVRHSLDRKVCNTLNVCCIVAIGPPSSSRCSSTPSIAPPPPRAAPTLASTPPRGDALVHAGAARSARVVHRADGTHDEPFVSEIDGRPARSRVGVGGLTRGHPARRR